MGFAGHKRFVLILLFCSLVAFDCIVSKKKEDTIHQQLLSWILTSGTNPSCLDYYSQENLCLKSPVPINEKCSSQEMDRLQSGIQPANLQNREVLEELLRCWSKCNSTFFLSHSPCSFETESDYVTAKRSGSTNNGNLWRQCQSNCNTGADPSFSKLKGISTTTTYWPYP
ncbi:MULTISPECIES: hypothetical protein [Leptospira]|uniref:Lipoprotein n=3 Tax=Leptospira santarosai TaxID=28183 RepID=A0AB73LPM5_9LEPT|nr:MULTISPECIES: hypothetical protein [Leptospira]EMO60035.1 hypothetical protein LEP1GSC161_0232 [Leptospira santarosai str. CBC1416]ASV12686.1 hypothetical protein B2G51_14655 [Leptospira santarosai]AVV51529.1 Uncharacterized protein XB17_02952 [Leptospira santarosai]AVV79819.1 Uncharacterized protein XB15_02051 [Leptospira santarosai]EKO79542.1 hypothetical protein LEP1GSC068_0915 [Leptospira sp. Fiocruz LV3954]